MISLPGTLPCSVFFLKPMMIEPSNFRQIPNAKKITTEKKLWQLILRTQISRLKPNSNDQRRILFGTMDKKNLHDPKYPKPWEWCHGIIRSCRVLVSTVLYGLGFIAFRVPRIDRGWALALFVGKLHHAVATRGAERI